MHRFQYVTVIEISFIFNPYCATVDSGLGPQVLGYSSRQNSSQLGGTLLEQSHMKGLHLKIIDT